MLIPVVWRLNLRDRRRGWSATAISASRVFLFKFINSLEDLALILLMILIGA